MLVFAQIAARAVANEYGVDGRLRSALLLIAMVRVGDGRSNRKTSANEAGLKSSERGRLWSSETSDESTDDGLAGLESWCRWAEDARRDTTV